MLRKSPWNYFANGAFFCFCLMMAIANAVTLEPRPEPLTPSPWLVALYSILTVGVLWLTTVESKDDH